MKSIKNAASVAVLMVGTVIGAGFASGRELYEFFAEDLNSVILTGLICSVLFFLFSIVFFKFGENKKINSFASLTVGIAGKRSVLLDASLAFCFIIVLAAMMSGIDSLFLSALNVKLPIFSVLSYMAATFFVLKGIRGLKIANALLVPMLVVFIIIITLLNVSGGERVYIENGNHFVITLADAILYVSMNMLLASVVLSQAGSSLNKRVQKILAAAIGSVMVGVLITLILFALTRGDYGNSPLPLMEMANKFGMPIYAISAVTLYLGIFTTLLSAYLPLYDFVESKVKRRIPTVIILFASSFLLSRLGFIKIVSAFYPIQSVLGLIIIAVIIINSEKNSQRYFIVNRSKSETRK